MSDLSKSNDSRWMHRPRIAWDKAAKKLYVAGKWWDRLYEIKVLR